MKSNSSSFLLAKVPDSPGNPITDFVLILREDKKVEDFLFTVGEMFAMRSPCFGELKKAANSL